MRYLTLFMALLILNGCAGALPWNDQEYAGINRFEVSLDENGNPTHVLLIGGKEQELIELTAKLPNGLEVTYRAEGVEAFPGQAIRATVEEAVSADVQAAFPGVVNAIVDALR